MPKRKCRSSDRRPPSSSAISSPSRCRPAFWSSTPCSQFGRGQRELIIGDRATGKTAIGRDTIINQKHSDLICVYVAIGQRATAVQRVIEAVQQHGAPERCVFVVASAAASPGLQWIAPFAGFTIAEYFRDRGQHALVIVDDLTKHAATHRETRFAHPRAARSRSLSRRYILSAFAPARALGEAVGRAGGGSLTALPIAETDAGNLSAYIPTNLISITDGQIVLNSAPLRRQPAPGRRCRPERQSGRRQSANRGDERGCRVVFASTMRNFSNWKCSPALAVFRTLASRRNHAGRTHPNPDHPAAFRRSASCRRGCAACCLADGVFDPCR